MSVDRSDIKRLTQVVVTPAFLAGVVAGCTAAVVVELRALRAALTRPNVDTTRSP
jgi:hypothetical protein